MLERLDQQLFLFLNSINSPFWDQVMYAVSGKVIWAPLYLSILIYLGIKYKRKFLIILLFIIVAVALADQTSVQLFKNIVQRLRPCHEPSLEGLVHLVKGECGGKFSFVSSHATNSFNIALISLLFIKKRWYTISIILWAAIIGYSRIYLGVHYPGDVICGSLLGAFIGWGIYQLYMLIDNNILKHKPFFNSTLIRPPIPQKRD
jgi:undecaprenyl-diphosphatase